VGILDWIWRRRPPPSPQTLRPTIPERILPPSREPPPELLDRLAAECATVPEVLAAYYYEAAGLPAHLNPHPAVGLQLEDEEIAEERAEELLSLLDRLARHFGPQHAVVQVLMIDELLLRVQATVPPFYERDAAPAGEV